MKYFSLNPILSRGGLLNFVIGQRSAGKTYAFKEWAIKDWLKNESEFVYVRRIDEEVQAVKGNLFDDIAGSFGIEVKSSGHRFLAREMPPEDVEDLKKWSSENPWRPFGYIIPLTEQQSFKSASFPKVNKICFDEFIIENTRKRYVPGEVEQFMSLILTVARNRQVKVVCLSNAGFISNPYFEHYGISNKSFSNAEFVKRNSGDVVFQLYHSEENAEEMKKGLIGRISGERYQKYALDSQFMDYSTENVVGKVKHGDDIMNLEGGYVISGFKGGYLIRRGRSSSSVESYTLSSFSTSSDFIYSQDVVARLRKLYNRRVLYFSDPDLRAWFISAI